MPIIVKSRFTNAEILTVETLRGANLSDANLSGADLRDADDDTDAHSTPLSVALEAMRLAVAEGYRGRVNGFSPGRYEAEPWYLPYFHAAALDGCGESLYDAAQETTDADLLDVSDDELAAFSLNDDTTAVAVTYSSQGFVGLRELNETERAELEASYAVSACSQCESEFEDDDNDAAGFDGLCRECMEKQNNVVSYTAPACWASYLINGDASGLEDDEQKACDAWIDSIQDEVEPGGPIDCVDAGFRRHCDAREFAPAADYCQSYKFFAKK